MSSRSRAFRLHLERLESRDLMAADLVLHWNEILLDAIRVERTSPPVASRAMAIVHAAIYDAVNAIHRTHEPYAVSVPALAITSAEAAVSAAAHATLSALFPAQTATFDAALTAALAEIPDGPAESLGIDLGENVAEQMLALRANDGSSVVVPYVPGTDPGNWQPTPPANAAALLPNWPDVTPFAMTSGSQFSPDDVPSLTSREYTKAFNEVKSLGSAMSTTRTSDQTNIALFWANGAGTATPPGHLNVLAAIVSDKKDLSLAQNARLFAMLNVALADAAIMCWDAKFATNFWRPITAIRAADTDGNPNTAVEAGWTPLIVTPPFPSYSSGHSSFSGAAAAVLKSFFGTDRISFTLPSEAPGVSDRSYKSFSQAAQESADSRLYGGIHWRFDNEDGLSSGTQLGKYVAKNFFQRATGSVSAGITDGALVVHGSEKNDNLSFVLRGDALVVFKSGKPIDTFELALFDELIVYAHGGNDIIRLGDEIDIPATLYGGSGNDKVYGGAANDLLFGEAGNDLLDGGLGNDLLDGGTGNNVFWDGPGLDTIVDIRGKRRFVWQA
jgi:hypothetical protein